MAMALLRTAAKQAARVATAARLQHQVPKVQTRSFAFGGRRRNDEDDEDRAHAGDEGGLYDPYKEYEQSTGERGYREFNPDAYEGEDPNFTWEEPEQMMEDKSWPATSGTDLFVDLLNIPNEPPTGEKMDTILAEAFARMGHTSNLDDIKLPEISVAIPTSHPDREALEIMKLSLMNNGRLKMDDKNELLTSIIDELDHLRKDKTQLFKGLEQPTESKAADKIK
ncbi:hypothetical protein BBJ28_00003902 [Nothophytophthora sp. Chile5]|nr:hypothetical protein BBJ28_00003902 [Nothophytophthora sp. Chile5]